MTRAPHVLPGRVDRDVRLRAGTLRLRVDRADMELDELCGFASRRSRKRGFVFVSKVLGKHYPVRPSVMRATHTRLAGRLLDVRGPVVVIGMAETATALALGFHDEWRRLSGRSDSIGLLSTRYRLERQVALGFSESHSHATQHWVYEPEADEAVRIFRSARTIVLIDDELTTGRTLAALAAAYRELNAAATTVAIVSLLDWLSAEQRAGLERMAGLPVAFHSLLQGEFRFEPDPAFDPGELPDVAGRDTAKDGFLRGNHGRLGVGAADPPPGPESALPMTPLSGERVLVLGTGEFMYPPFRLAERLEASGHAVSFQSTTRSPLVVERDLTSVLEFVDNYHDGIPNYLYNVADRHYDRVLIGYETAPLPAAHRLAELLNAQAVFF